MELFNKILKKENNKTAEKETSDKTNIDEYLSAAKKMYFEYECSEYKMKLDNVLEKYLVYNVPNVIQLSWKKEYISDLFKKLEKDGDLVHFKSLCAFSRDATNADIFKRLYDYFTGYSNDIELGTKMIFSLSNAVNYFSAKDDYVRKILEELCLYLENIIARHESDDTVNRAVRCKELLVKIKLHNNNVSK